MKVLQKICLLIAFLATLQGSISAQVSVTVTNPTNTTPNLMASYTSLANAISALSGITSISGPVTLTAAAGSETAPTGGYVINFTAATTATNNVTIIGTTTTTITAPTPQTSGNLNDAIFKIIGSDYVTIRNFTMQENGGNTTTTAATNNMTEWGVALLYASTTNGAQNCTIRNNTISLNRTYQNTFGIYSNSTHSATAVTTPASATTTAGGNSGLTIWSNSISNVNIGIVVVGPTAAADHNEGLDIGGSDASTGNTLTNYGTTGTFSGYANVQLTVNGILVRNTRNFNVSFNSITSSVGGTTSGTLRAIFVSTFSTAPTGTLANTITDNTIALTHGVSNVLQGIVVEPTTGNATSSLNIDNNNFTAFTCSVPSSVAFTAISDAMPNLNTSISGNKLTNISTNTSGSFTFISHSFTMPAGGATDISQNEVVTGFTKSTAGGAVTFSTTGASSPGGTTATYTDNVFSNITVTGATAITGINSTDGTTGTSVKTVTGNDFSNWTNGGAFPLLGINISYFHTGAHTISSNTISNLNGQGTITGISLNNTLANATSLTVESNTITGLTSSGTGGTVIGIGCTNASPTVNINGNTINTLSSTGASSTVSGISGGAATTYNIFKNKIYDLSGNQTGTIVNGINITSGTTLNISNNLIGDLRATAATGLNAINGINASATATYNVYYNSIYLNATSSSATTFGNSCITFSSTATSFNSRNNILVNTSTPAQDGSNTAANGIAACLRRSGGTGGTVPANYATTSNNNAYWVNPTAGTNNHLTYVEGTSTITNPQNTVANMKAFMVNRDQASAQENVSFQSTSGANANFLKYNTGSVSQLESGAANIATFTDDYAGTIRQGNGGYAGTGTAPDIGAWELEGTPQDLTGPVITYTTFANTSCTVDRSLTPVTTTDASGVNTTAGTRPRFYYKKSTNADTYVDNTNGTDGWKYVEASGAGGSPFSFTTNYSLLFGGTPIIGDVIQYFVVAQDLAGTPNIGINSGSFAAPPTSVALTAAAFPLGGAVNSYTIIAAGLSGTVTIGASGTYTSLTGASGLFSAVNTSGLSGALTVNIVDASVTETGATALNAISYNGCAAGPYTVTIKPNTTATLTGAVGTGAIIKLNGADYVTIDGSNSGGSDRSLTIANTTTTTSGNAVVWLASPASGNGSTNNTIKNCIIEGNSATTTFTGVHIGGGGTIGITTAGNELNSNNTINNNLFRKTQYGATLFGWQASTPDLNNAITNNNFGTPTVGEGFSILAINANRQSGLVVSGNEVQNVTNATNTSSAPFGGIRLLDFKNGLCFNNNIHDLAYTNASTSKIYGIAVTSSSYTTAGNPSNAQIYNNMVSRITSTGTSGIWNTTGILASAGYGDKYYYNTVNMTGQVANSSAGRVAAFANGDENINTVCTNIDVRNNIFSLTGSSGTPGGNFWAYYTTATTLSGSTLNHNDLHCNGTNATNNVGRFNATNYATLAAWQAATSQDANSVSIAPVFTSDTDLHLPAASNISLFDLGTPIGGVTTDIDNETRAATTPDIGADEFSAITLNLTAFIEGYYLGASNMSSVLLNSGVAGATASQCDTITVQLRNSTMPYGVAASFKGVLGTNGTLTCAFPSDKLGGSYFIALRHRNALQTWSGAGGDAPTSFSTVSTSYNFSTAASQAYGSNMVDMGGGVWALYSGDMDNNNLNGFGDGAIDNVDFGVWLIDNNAFAEGYVQTDLNGDGFIDSTDFAYWLTHSTSFVEVLMPAP
jgi:hypothetical protein